LFKPDIHKTVQELSAEVTPPLWYYRFY